MEEARDDEIFVYMGGDQEVPMGVRRVRIHKSVKIIPAKAFRYRTRLIHVEFHDGIDIIGEEAFYHCHSLRGPIKLQGVKIIKAGAFANCDNLTDVEFGDELITIERKTFRFCKSLRSIKMLSVRTIGGWAFDCCFDLCDVKCGEELETIGERAFQWCENLKRITLPLKDDIIADNSFIDCFNLTSVHLVEGIHKTVASLHLESWRNDMREEINRITEVLLNVEDRRRKTPEIQHWIGSVIRRIKHYEAEHKALLKESSTLLELALWKANLDDNDGGAFEREGVRTTRGRRKRARKEVCITSGAGIVIKNVLPFLRLE